MNEYPPGNAYGPVFAPYSGGGMVAESASMNQFWGPSRYPMLAGWTNPATWTPQQWAIALAAAGAAYYFFGRK